MYGYILFKKYNSFMEDVRERKHGGIFTGVCTCTQNSCAAPFYFAMVIYLSFELKCLNIKDY